MKAVITVEMDNAAFDDDAGAELARIVRELAEKIDVGLGTGNIGGCALRDINGNTVGSFKVVGRR